MDKETKEDKESKESAQSHVPEKVVEEETKKTDNDKIKIEELDDSEDKVKGKKKEEIEDDFFDDEDEEENRSSKKLLILIGVIIGIFIVFFAFSFGYNKFFTGNSVLTLSDLHVKNLNGEFGEENYIYNGFSFVYLDNLWYTQVMRPDGTLLDIPLRFGPKDIENVSTEGVIDESFMKNEVYVTFDPTDTPLSYVALSASELSSNLASGMGVLPVAACSENETDACAIRPIVDCDDKDKAVIYLKKSNSSASVKLNGNCVILEGEDWELIKAVDRFLYKWYQVMK